jgi:hypothetical protein
MVMGGGFWDFVGGVGVVPIQEEGPTNGATATSRRFHRAGSKVRPAAQSDTHPRIRYTDWTCGPVDTWSVGF